ncbi:hypothetical protein TNCV_2578871 [Trichonephila clavipes]|nr:hypothetical protein TNCV_2578871 [Trichonephila clavipes]
MSSSIVRDVAAFFKNTLKFGPAGSRPPQSSLDKIMIRIAILKCRIQTYSPQTIEFRTIYRLLTVTRLQI